MHFSGVLHTTAGYMIYAATTFKYVFDYHPEDVYFCTADVGWITGASRLSTMNINCFECGSESERLSTQATCDLRISSDNFSPRPQLLGLRPTSQRGHGYRLRGRSFLPRRRTILGDLRQIRRLEILYGADGDSRAHEVWRRLGQETWPVQTQSPGISRGTHQPGSLALVLSRRRWLQLFHRRYVLANWNRRTRAYAVAG